MIAKARELSLKWGVNLMTPTHGKWKNKFWIH